MFETKLGIANRFYIIELCIDNVFAVILVLNVPTGIPTTLHYLFVFFFFIFCLCST